MVGLWVSVIAGVISIRDAKAGGVARARSSSCATRLRAYAANAQLRLSMYFAGLGLIFCFQYVRSRSSLCTAFDKFEKRGHVQEYSDMKVSLVYFSSSVWGAGRHNGRAKHPLNIINQGSGGHPAAMPDSRASDTLKLMQFRSTAVCPNQC